MKQPTSLELLATKQLIMGAMQTLTPRQWPTFHRFVLDGEFSCAADTLFPDEPENPLPVYIKTNTALLLEKFDFAGYLCDMRDKDISCKITTLKITDPNLFYYLFFAESSWLKKHAVICELKNDLPAPSPDVDSTIKSNSKINAKQIAFFLGACSANHLQLAKRVVEVNREFLLIFEHSFSIACRYNATDVIQWIYSLATNADQKEKLKEKLDAIFFCSFHDHLKVSRFHEAQCLYTLFPDSIKSQCHQLAKENFSIFKHMPPEMLTWCNKEGFFLSPIDPVNQSDNYLQQLFFLALHNNFLTMAQWFFTEFSQIKIFLDSNQNVLLQELKNAFCQGHTSVLGMDWLYNLGADSTQLELQNFAKKYIHRACKRGSTEMLAWFLSLPNAQTTWSEIPKTDWFISACNQGHVKVAKFLFKHSTPEQKYEIRKQIDITFLLKVFDKSHSDMAQFLLNFIDLTPCKLKVKLTLFFSACAQNNPELAQLILTYIKSSELHTALETWERITNSNNWRPPSLSFPLFARPQKFQLFFHALNATQASGLPIAGFIFDQLSQEQQRNLLKLDHYRVLHLCITRSADTNQLDFYDARRCLMSCDKYTKAGLKFLSCLSDVEQREAILFFQKLSPNKTSDACFRVITQGWIDERFKSLNATDQTDHARTSFGAAPT